MGMEFFQGKVKFWEFEAEILAFEVWHYIEHNMGKVVKSDVIAEHQEWNNTSTQISTWKKKLETQVYIWQGTQTANRKTEAINLHCLP